MRKAQEYRHQLDCRGGVNLEPENIRDDQVLDARNVWCPHGKLEQRPGYVGIYSPFWTVLSSGDILTEWWFLLKESPVGTFSDSTTPISVAGLADGERWYYGFTIADESTYTAQEIADFFKGIRYFFVARDGVVSVNTNANVRVKVEYWNGTHWEMLETKEYQGNDQTSGPSAEAVPTSTLLGHATVTDLYSMFSLVMPADMGKTTLTAISGGTAVDLTASQEGTPAYWLRFTVLENDSGNGISNPGPSIAADDALNLFATDGVDSSLTASNLTIGGIFIVPFREHERTIVVGASDRLAVLNGAGYSVLYENSKGLSHVDSLRFKSKSVDPSQSTASIAIVPQFREAFISYRGVTTRHTAEPAGTRSVTAAPDEIEYATVESNPALVGVLYTDAGGNNVLADYHPDNLAQLDVWPQAKYIMYFSGFLWAANLKEDPTSIRWSAASPAHKVWPVESIEELSEQDASPITGLSSLGEHAVVFKQDSVWRMVNDSVDDIGLATFVPVKDWSGVGCVSNSSIARTPLGLIFLGEEGVYLYSGTSAINKISTPIDPLVEDINKSKRHNAVGVHWKDQNVYLLSVATGASDINNTVLVFDYLRGAWWIWDNMNVHYWIPKEGENDQEELYFADDRGRVFQFGLTNRDNGAAIEAYIKTNRFYHPEYETRTFRSIIVNGTNEVSSLDYELEVEDVSVLSGSISFTDPAENLTDGSTITSDIVDDAPFPTQRRERRVDIRKTGQWATVKISNDNKNQKMSLSKVGLGAIPIGRR